MVLPVRLSGTDSDGKPYSILAHTLDFSRRGARLGGIRAALRVGETVTLEYKLRRGHFAVRWVGPPGTRSERQAGVHSLEPEVFLWLEVPEQQYTDDVDPSRRRAKPVSPVRATTTENPSEDTVCAATLRSPTPGKGSDSNAVSRALESEPAPMVEELLSTVDRASEGESQLDSAKSGNGDGPLDQNSILIGLEQHIVAEGLPLNAALDLIAENAQRLLNGSGAAIALPDDHAMVCRASAGRAPAIGVRFRAESGLTGEAVRSGRVVTCHNTLCDPRVDPEVWRKVGIRSTVSVPIPLSEGRTGILELFATQSNAFTSAHGILLEALSGLVSCVLSGYSER